MIVTLLGVAHIFSIFSLLNGFAYDVLTRTNPSTEASEKIIVIETDSSYAELGDDVWLELLKQLLNSDVKQIAFTVMPKQASSQFYQMAAESRKVIFGTHVISNSDGFEFNELKFPRNAVGKKIVYGLISTAPSEYGVYRKQHSVIKANDISFPSFEMKVAEQVLEKPVLLPETDFRVNFIGNQKRIPKIRIERILSGGLVRELVSGRTVLIGVNQHQTLSQYRTPVSTDQQLTSQVMFHAFALDTLLSDRYITVLPITFFVLVILLITVVSLLLYQWLAFQMSIVITIIASGMYVIASWIVLHLFSIWIPITELLLAQVISFILVWFYRVKHEHQSLDLMISEFSLKLRDMAKPVSIYASEEPWDQLIAMVNQSLYLNRIIFLERVPGNHNLKEIKALNCSIDDIEEKRRDFQRAPYSIAISENRPILLENIYLKEVFPVDQQYMAPLIFGGEVLGFWVYTVEPEKVQSQAKFNILTRAFMVQIGEILHYRQEWKKNKEKEKNKLSGYLRIEGTEHLNQLNQFISLIDKRNFELQGVLNSINTNCVLFDLFGKVSMVNTDMNILAQEANLRLFNMTMLEFIIEIGGFDESGARNIVQRIMFDHELISIPVTYEELKRSFILNIRPLSYQEESSRNMQIPNENHVFPISGVLCELVNITELKRLYQLKEAMLERYNYAMRDDLSSLMLTLQILDNEQTSAEKKQVALSNIRNKVKKTLNMIGQVSEQMEVEIENLLTNNSLCYPIDSTVALQRVIENLEDTIDQRDIKISLQLPKTTNLVFASPLDLEKVLHAVLLAMIEDTYDADNIWIELEKTEKNITYNIYNNGIGISDDTLLGPGENNLHRESETINFHYAINCVKRWGGSLSITTQMGEGSKAELVLRCFL